MSRKISVAKFGNVFGSIIRFSFAVLNKVEKTFNFINIFCKNCCNSKFAYWFWEESKIGFSQRFENFLSCLTKQKQLF